MEKGEIKYSEVVRENVRKLEAYVEEMASGDTVLGAVNIQKVQDDVLKLWSVVKALPEISLDQKNHIKSLYEGVLRSLNNLDSNPRSAPRSRRSSSQFLQPQVTGVTAVTSLSSDKKADFRRAIARDISADFKIINGVESERLFVSMCFHEPISV